MIRLDKILADRKLAQSRSQAENLIELGHVKVNGKVVKKSNFQVGDDDTITIDESSRYVSRAALKLKSVADRLKLNFSGAIVLDVGSSTGGFTDFALKHGAKQVIAVDVGTDQMHPSLRDDPRIELHEKTDIRDLNGPLPEVNVVVIDVSFISLKEVLPVVKKLATNKNVTIVAMMKPQFEAPRSAKHKGVIKNSKLRRDIIKDFETWLKQSFVIISKADSEVSGVKGNQERFYKLVSIRER